jgi:ribosomal protein S18 acetylase RimI-like enzyme
MYELRPVTEDDREWLYQLNRSSMRDHVIQTWGSWDEASQREYFDGRFVPERRQIIRTDGADVGALIVERDPSRLRIGDIALLPAVQSRGIGTEVIRDLLDEAASLEIPVELQVLKVNPARRLYERLGFAAFDETETHILMRASQ